MSSDPNQAPEYLKHLRRLKLWRWLFYAILVAFLLLNLADSVETWYAIERYGNVEQNPSAHYMIEQYGYGVVVLQKFTGVAVVCIAAWLLRATGSPRTGFAVLWAFGLIMAFVVVGNFTAISAERVSTTVRLDEQGNSPAMQTFNAMLYAFIGVFVAPALLADWLDNRRWGKLDGPAPAIRFLTMAARGSVGLVKSLRRKQEKAHVL